jgi:DNA-binding LytR/AlgR family response regulator
MKKLTCVVLDDEPLATEIIMEYLKHFPFIALPSVYHDSQEAKVFLQQQTTDLLILDIEMPGLTGIELVKTLEPIPYVIFTTAYPNFAVEGFELQAFDYLLKPIGFERFRTSMERLSKKLHASKKDITEESVSNDYFFVKADRKLQKIYFQDIQFIEGLKDYVMIHTTRGRIITLQTMKHLSENLPAKIFRRIHRSFIININYISSATNQMIEIETKSGKRALPIGKLFKDQIKFILVDKKLE